MTSLVKSVFVIQICTTDKPNVIGCNEVKYLAYDQQSGGYPWYPDDWPSAKMFRSYDQALEEFKLLKDPTPTVHGGHKGDAFRQFAIPNNLSRIAGGPTNLDGKYRFVAYLLEIKGNTLLTSNVIKRERLIIDVEQWYNVPNRPIFMAVAHKLFPIS